MYDQKVKLRVRLTHPILTYLQISLKNDISTYAIDIKNQTILSNIENDNKQNKN